MFYLSFALFHQQNSASLLPKESASPQSPAKGGTGSHPGGRGLRLPPLSWERGTGGGEADQIERGVGGRKLKSRSFQAGF